MKKLIIAFDVDGTLINNEDGGINERIRALLIILSSFKNTRIIVWSGQGIEWSKTISKEIGIEDYVDGYDSKNHKGKDENGKHIFEPNIIPDICIDDIQACNLGKINLIVNEK